MTHDLRSSLQNLAAALGVATEFWDWRGRHVDVSEETIVAVLSAMGADASDPEQALADHHRARWTRLLPSVLVLRQGQTPSIDVHVPHGSPVEIWVELEGGGARGGLRQLENWAQPMDLGHGPVGEATFEVPADLPLGYHTVRVRAAGMDGSMPLVVTPGWLGLPERLGAARTWGVATQIYSVRSRESWGLGDLTDLTDLAVWSAAEHGAGYVLVNPLHAVQPTVPMEPSPYLPTTRRFANPMYLRVERVPEYADLDEEARSEITRLRASVKTQLDDADRIDRDAAWAGKRAALELLHRAPRTAGRELSYRAYRQREGQGLLDYATWCAIAESYGQEWRSWPEGLRRPGTPEVQAYADGHADLVDLHCWMQWLVDEQLDHVQAAVRRAGMPLGVVHDLAVGVNPTGSEAWSLQDVFADRVTVGAPPDAYAQTGQDWSQPPWRPDRLAETAYAAFREMVATVLRHAGGIRVDHVIGLFRLWWIPQGMSPTQGTYVRYDHEALVGILALEAHRAGAVVVGEDVGVVEPWVRAYLRERGILGTSILWFEFDYDGDGAPLAPERWRELCLASVTTHDLPPTTGYLAADHVRLRDRLGLLTRPVEEELAEDSASREAWLADLRSRGLLAADADVEATVAALHRFLTLTPSRLLGVALTDLVGDRRTQNQPGTSDEYPNWRVPLSDADGRLVLLEDLMSSERATTLAATMG
jgi:4-alpha-glucanotransferase